VNIEDFNEFLKKKFDGKIKIISTHKEFKYRDYIESNCEIHGSYKIRYDHLKDYGCPKCLILKNKDKNKKYFIERANIKHNNRYDYSNVEYNTNKTPVEIICKKHGSFFQRPDNHLSGAGCKYCNYLMSSDDFIERSNKIHNNKYNYDKTKYFRDKDKVVITCKNHGDFTQRGSSHLNGSGCPICQESNGEKVISNYLNKIGINYKREKKFIEFNKYIEFDFYLSDYNACIEYDGIQHFKPIDFFGGKKRFDYTKKNDNLKNIFCHENDIKLFRISYLQNIEEEMDKIIQKLKISVKISQ